MVDVCAECAAKSTGGATNYLDALRVDDRSRMEVMDESQDGSAAYKAQSASGIGHRRSIYRPAQSARDRVNDVTRLSKARYLHSIQSVLRAEVQCEDQACSELPFSKMSDIYLVPA